MGKMKELNALLEPYLKELKCEMLRNGYNGAFVFEYQPENKSEGSLTLHHLLHPFSQQGK